MAICMSVAAGHIHEEAGCDAQAANGRSTTVVAIRLPDDLARKVRDLAGTRDSVNEYLIWLITTQAARTR